MLWLPLYRAIQSIHLDTCVWPRPIAPNTAITTLLFSRSVWVILSLISFQEPDWANRLTFLSTNGTHGERRLPKGWFPLRRIRSWNNESKRSLANARSVLENKGWFPLQRIQSPRTGTIACSSIEKKKSDWLPLILVTKKLKLIQLPELTARSPVNARFQLGFRATHVQIAHHLVERRKFAEMETGRKVEPATRPGIEPGTSWLAVRDLSNCANLAH